MNDTAKGLPQTPGVYQDCDGDLWVFLWPFDTSTAFADDLYGIRFAYSPNHWSDDDPRLKSDKQYQFFAPFTKVEHLDALGTDKEKTETKNMENATPLTEDTTPVENVDPFEYKCTTLKGCGAGCPSLETEISTTAQGLVVIRCNDCHRMICGDSINFYQLVEAWNKGSERP